MPKPEEKAEGEEENKENGDDNEKEENVEEGEENNENDNEINDDNEISMGLQELCTFELSELEEVGDHKSNIFHEERGENKEGRIGMDNLFEIEKCRLFVKSKEDREVYEFPYKKTAQTTEYFAWNIEDMLEKYFNKQI